MMVMMLAENEPDDDALLALAREGDRDAFARIIERYYDFIHRVAWRWCGRAGEAEDIAQTVCMRLAGAIRGFRGDGRFTTWLYALTLNAARDHGRKVAREVVRADAYAVHARAEAAIAPEPDDVSERLWTAVRGLPAKQCEAVLLVYGEGLTHAAAAEVMGCAETTVSWHIHEAKKRLRVVMRRAGED